jgi:hypothetical protein
MKAPSGLWVTLFCFILLSPQVSTRASEDLVSGKWRCHGKGPSGEDVDFVLDLKQSGDSVTGTVTVGHDVVGIDQGSIRANEMELVISTDDNRFVSAVTVEDRKLTATWKDANGKSGTWQGERVAAEAN